MRYAGWSAEHEEHREDKHWCYRDADIHVTVNKDTLDNRYRVQAHGDDIEPLINGEWNDQTREDILEWFETKERAMVFAKALLDSLHAVYSVHHREPLPDKDWSNRSSRKEYFQKSFHVRPYYEEEEDIREGYYTGLIILGAEEASGLAHKEYNRQVVSYYMTAHDIEPEVSYRYSVVDYKNDFDDYSIVEKSRKRAGLEPIEDL